MEGEANRPQSCNLAPRSTPGPMAPRHTSTNPGPRRAKEGCNRSPPTVGCERSLGRTTPSRTTSSTESAQSRTPCLNTPSVAPVRDGTPKRRQPLRSHRKSHSQERAESTGPGNTAPATPAHTPSVPTPERRPRTHPGARQADQRRVLRTLKSTSRRRAYRPRKRPDAPAWKIARVGTKYPDPESNSPCGADEKRASQCRRGARIGEP